MRKQPSPTIKDVALHAGVSFATVTNVLHGRDSRFTAETEARVRHAIEKLGYRPNQIARSLVRRRSNTLGIVVEHIGESLVQNPYFAMLFDGFLLEAIGGGYQAKIIVLPRTDEDSIRRQTEDGSVDGAILAAPRYGSPTLAWAERASLPCVVAGTIPTSPAVSCVDVDDEGGVYEAVRWLVSLGHRRIGMIAGPIDYWSARQREQGYHRAMQSEGLRPEPEWIGRGDYSSLSGQQAVRALIHVRPRLTAVFAANDWMALGALETLRREGVRVPEDMSVVGFDDAEGASVVHPPLTTIRQPVRQIGARAAQILVRQAKHGDTRPERTVFPGVLVVRESAAPR